MRLYFAGLNTSKRTSVQLIRLRAGGAARHSELRVLGTPNMPRKHCAGLGQWVFLSVPRLHLLHLHPFVICSSSFGKDTTLHLTGGGRRTSKVAALALEEPKIRVRCNG